MQNNYADRVTELVRGPVGHQQRALFPIAPLSLFLSMKRLNSPNTKESWGAPAANDYGEVTFWAHVWYFEVHRGRFVVQITCKKYEIEQKDRTQEFTARAKCSGGSNLRWWCPWGSTGKISIGDVRDKVSHVCSYWMMCAGWFIPVEWVNKLLQWTRSFDRNRRTLDVMCWHYCLLRLRQQYAAEASCFSVVRPSVVCPIVCTLTAISRERYLCTMWRDETCHKCS